ncbi:MAG: MCP four helix bundle domain-containing protein, partial [Acidovorax sp.]|uniref:MCP four helix bundle domain-containing protein n=1 Tax=Acidovorax sp. TaxID=1872122 RepID=UPI00391BA64B
MNQLKISTRLTAAFAVMVLLLIALGAVSLIQSASQRAELNDVIDVRIPITKSMGVLADGVNVQAIQFRNLALFSEESITKPSLERVTAARAAIAEQMGTLTTLIQSDKGKEILGRLQQNRASFLKIGDQYLGLIQQGQKDEALKLLVEQVRPIQLEYQKVIAEQVDFQAKVTAEAGQRAEAAASALTRDVLIAGALAIVVAIFLAITIIRSITRPLAQAVEAADRVASGDLSGQIIAQSKDETGHLLAALQRMQQSLVNTVSSVRQNAEGVASASSQIASGNNDLSART